MACRISRMHVCDYGLKIGVNIEVRAWIVDIMHVRIFKNLPDLPVTVMHVFWHESSIECGGVFKACREVHGVQCAVKSRANLEALARNNCALVAVLALLLRRVAPMHLSARARTAMQSLATSADVSADVDLSSAIW